MTPLVNDLGQQIMRNINASADVNAVNLVAMVLLATPRHATGEAEVLKQLDLYRTLLSGGTWGERITITERDGEAMLTHASGLGFIERVEHPLGDIIRVVPDQAVGLTYYRNNISHLLAIPALVACCFQLHRRIPLEALARATQDAYPFLRNELFLPWKESDIPGVLENTIKQFLDLGLLNRSEDGMVIERGPGGGDEASQLNLLARTLLPTLERYYIAIAVLNKNGSGTLSREQLERLCMLTAQRISLVQEFNSPEFYDRNLFRQFIGELRRLDMLTSNEDGTLAFDEHLARMSRDARLLLAKHIRHSIIQVAPSVLEDQAADD